MEESEWKYGDGTGDGHAKLQEIEQTRDIIMWLREWRAYFWARHEIDVVRTEKYFAQRLSAMVGGKESQEQLEALGRDVASTYARIQKCHVTIREMSAEEARFWRQATVLLTTGDEEWLKAFMTGVGMFYKDFPSEREKRAKPLLEKLGAGEMPYAEMEEFDRWLSAVFNYTNQAMVFCRILFYRQMEDFTEEEWNRFPPESRASWLDSLLHWQSELKEADLKLLPAHWLERIDPPEGQVLTEEEQKEPLLPPFPG